MPKLVYFPLMGRAQAIRFLLASKNVDFEDERLSFEEWGPIKAAGTYGVGAQLPVYVKDDGTIQSQSVAILKALAHEHGYVATTAKAIYESEWFYSTYQDTMEKPERFAIMKDDATEEQQRACVTVLENGLDRLEAQWNDGRTSVTGEGITDADFFLLQNLVIHYENANGKHQIVRDGAAAKLAACPNVLRVAAGVRELCAPTIAAMPAAFV